MAPTPGRRSLPWEAFTRAIGGAAVLWLAAGSTLATESFQIFSPSIPLERYFDPDLDDGFSPFRQVSLSQSPTPDEQLTLDVGALRPGDLAQLFAPSSRQPSRFWSTAVIGGVVAGAVVSVLGAGHEGRGFNFANEEWFQEGTYAGGADKASHFVMYNALSRELGVSFQRMGYAKGRALWMGFGTAMAAGLITEIGDGLTNFGFAWQDLLVDALGSGTAVLVSHYNLDDTVGFRYGKVSADEPPECCRTAGIGKDYSQEIYTADLKIEGFARRIHVRPGPARFLLLSMTYGSKGYRFSLPEFRQRNVGIELGLNFPSILSAVGVPEQKWWGRIIYIFFNFVRIPFTQIGYYYDLNKGKWHGPDAGNVYDPGP
jgi:hypothetical protein